MAEKDLLENEQVRDGLALLYIYCSPRFYAHLLQTASNPAETFLSNIEKMGEAVKDRVPAPVGDTAEKIKRQNKSMWEKIRDWHIKYPEGWK